MHLADHLVFRSQYAVSPLHDWLQVTALRQQLKLSSAKAQTAESKYATHAGSMAALQGRAEVAEKSAQHAQASLTKLQVRFAWTFFTLTCNIVLGQLIHAAHSGV